jgi:hypothetical protein
MHTAKQRYIFERLHTFLHALRCKTVIISSRILYLFLVYFTALSSVAQTIQRRMKGR